MGFRYTGPVYLKLVGDKLAASKLIGRARTLLGILHSVIKPHGATSGSRTYNLPTGETIRVLVAGAINKIEIISPPLANKLRNLLLRGFVCTVSYDNPLPTAISEYPQVVLSPNDDSWGAWFYSGNAFFSGSNAEPKATYGQDYLNGLKHAGQIDWRSKDGVHISWHGPANRYWWSPAFFQFLAWSSLPSNYFGRKVYCAGKVLLDTDAYDTANATSLAGFVMGAGLLKIGAGSYHLFVILRVQFNNDSDTLHRVVRYNCVVDQNIQNDLCKLRVVNGTGQLLFTFNSQFSKSPWFFNEDCTEAVHMSDDRTFANGAYREFWYTDYSFSNLGTFGAYPPPLSNRIVTLSLTSSSISSETVSVPVPGATGVSDTFPHTGLIPVAVDFRGNERVTAYLQYRSFFEPTSSGQNQLQLFDVFFIVGNSEYHLARTYNPKYFASAAESESLFYCPTVFFRQIKYADLRNDFLFTYTEEIQHSYPRYDENSSYVYGGAKYKDQILRAGVVVFEQLNNERPQSTNISASGEGFARSVIIPLTTIQNLPSTYFDTPSIAPRLFMNAGWNTAGYYDTLTALTFRDGLYTGFLHDANPIPLPTPTAFSFASYNTSQLVEDEDGFYWPWAAGYLDGKIFVSSNESGFDFIPSRRPLQYLTGGDVALLTGVRKRDDPRAYPMFVLDKLPE